MKLGAGVVISLIVAISAEQLCDEYCGQLYNAVKHPKIIGGKLFAPNKYPWLIPIKISTTSGVFFCGATIIKRSYLLTAAHCLEVENITKTEALIGYHWLPNSSHNKTTGFEEIISAKHAVLHEDYDTDTVNNDIALLELEKPIKFSPSVHAVCLPRPDDSPAITNLDKKTAIVAGWGTQNDTDGAKLPLKPHAANVTIWAWNKCKSLLSRDLLITENMICANEEGKDACRGDSGGPLIVLNHNSEDSGNELHEVNNIGRYAQVGIVSWGMGCASDFPGMYTRVSRYIGWIQNVTSNLDNCNPFAPK